MFSLKRRFFGPGDATTGSGNHLRLGIMGYPNSGKSTLFNALTRPSVPSTTEDFLFSTLDVRVGHLICQDTRLDWLAGIYHTDNVTRIHATVVDGPAIVARSFYGEGEGLSFLNKYQEADVLINVVRGFDSVEVTHYDDGKVDPIRDAKALINELMHADLCVVEKHLVVVEKQIADMKKDFAPIGQHKLIEVRTLIKCWECLMGCDRAIKDVEHLKEMKRLGVKPPPEKEIPEILEGVPLRFALWSTVEIEFLKKYCFFSTKEMVYLLNVSPRDHVRGYSKWLKPFRSTIDEIGGGLLIHLSCVFEQDLAREAADGNLPVYMAANPTHKSSLPDLLYACSRALDLISFYTFTPETRELKAWACRQGTTIKDAAALIDFYLFRDFQRGEVYSYDDLVEFAGNFDLLQEFGKHRHQVKQYAVVDGDVIDFVIYKKSDSKSVPSSPEKT